MPLIKSDYTLIGVSKRLFVVAKMSDCNASLNVFSRGKFGAKDEMFVSRRARIISQKLSHSDAMYLQACLYGADSYNELPEDAYQMLLESKD